MNFNLIKKVILLSLVLFFGNALLTSAASTVTINNYYNLNNGQNCNLGSASVSDQNCSSFVGQLGGYSFLPVSNNQMVYDSASYGGESIVNFTNNIIGPNAVTQYVGSSVQSNIGVAYVQGDITAVSATYLCSGPGGVRQYSVPVTQRSGVFSTFADVDTTAQDCSVTINFNQASTNSGGSNDGGSGGGGGGDPGDPPPPIIDDTFSSVSVSANPESETVTYGVNTTKYFTVVVNKTNDVFPANILVDCEVLVRPGSGGGECAFVDSNNNPIPNTKAGEYPTAAAFGRYPSQYMAPGVTSMTLRLAVRNYDQYGGISAVKTHTIPIQAGLLDSPFPLVTFYGPQIQRPRCNGSCTAGDTINMVVENPLLCQATNSINATSPAAANRTFTLSWGAVPGASTYTVEVKDQTSCLNTGLNPSCGPVVYNGTVSGTSAVIPFGGDVAGLPNKRFGYFIGTNYSPSRNACSNIGSVLVNNPVGGTPPPGGNPPPSGPSGTVSITCNGSQNVTISSGQSCNLAWSSADIVAGSCVASGSWSGAKAGSGTETRSNITQNSSYTITCRDNNGVNVTSTANVTVAGAPTANIKCNDADACTAVRFSSTPNLTWSCGNSSSAFVSPGNYTNHPNGARTVGPFSSGSSVTYNLTCTSSTGATATDSVTINIADNPPAGTPAYRVDLYPNPLTFNVEKGNSWSGSAVITNIGDTTLNISAYIDNVVSNFGGWYTPMSPTVVCPNLLPSTFYTCSFGIGGHTINVDPFTTNTFDLNVTDDSAAPDYLDIPVTVNVGARPSCPTASVILARNTIDVGQSTTASAPSGLTNCTYSTSNASVASLSGNPRNVVNGLSAGTSNISARCDYGDQICNVNPATINVTTPSSPSPTTYSFSVSPASLSFNAIQNAAVPASKTVTVTNTGTGALNITRTQNMTSGSLVWGSADSASFSLAAGASRVVTVSINSTAGDPGNYDGTVTFTDSNAGSKQVPVAYVINPSSSTRTIDVGTNWCGTVTSSPSGISCGTTCNAGFDYNDTVTLTATPNTQCLFIGWLGDCAGQDATCDLLMNSDRSATPIFGLKPFNYEEF